MTVVSQHVAALEQLVSLFLRQAPRLPSAGLFGVATSLVEPWPHQARVVRRTVERFPQSFLFADEVGLGKTIEIGLVLRQLILSGRVRRALILAPSNLLRQWQEELHEKMGLASARYDGRRLHDVHGGSRPVSTATVWDGTAGDGTSLLLASSQLVRRRARRRALLAAAPWDLVVVDEAHHARRRSARPSQGGSSTPQPNRLLELLGGGGGLPGLRDRARCLYLVTATPMQVHPVEIWDLLRLLGLGGAWGADEARFLEYFRQLRRPPEERDWPVLLDLLAEELEEDAADATDAIVDDFADLQRGLPARWTALRELPGAADRAQRLRALDADSRRALEALLRRRTPLARLVWRHGRAQLRAYRKAGLLEHDVPERRPRNIWIELDSEARGLYERIESYIADHYRRAEAERRGLGFVMTVYRRRLTSSQAAIRCSLGRRLALLRGAGSEPSPVEENPGDIERDAERDGELRIGAFLRIAETTERHREIGYVEDFLAALQGLGADPKVERLLADLETLLRPAGRHATALVFTQYLDTLDAVRDAVAEVYGSAAACDSGRGGERWDSAAWAPCDKETLRDAFRCAEVRVLICTESASEGLNFQTCGLLINFDMPWNPMRVEQRIGRVDRIGQEHAEIDILSYFYADTVEATIYRRLSDRIAWFETVVGALPPILHRVGEAIQEVAMRTGRGRLLRLEEEIAALRGGVDTAEADPLAWVEEEAPPPTAQAIETFPIDPSRLDEILTSLPSIAAHLRPDPEFEGAYHLRLPGRAEERRVTFSAALFERHPYRVDWLTWGHPDFGALLDLVPQPTVSEEPAGLGLYSAERPSPMSLFLVHDADGARPLTTLDELLAASLAEPWSGDQESRAAALFSQERRRMLEITVRVEERRRRAERRALEDASRRVLERAAWIELAASRSPGLFDDGPRIDFGGTGPVEDMARRGMPFSGLVEHIAELPAPRADHPYYLKLLRRTPASLERLRTGLRTEAEEILRRFAELDAESAAAQALLRAPSAIGVLERRWYLPEGVELPTPRAAVADLLDLVDGAEVRPFRDAVPLYEDLAEAADRFAENPTQDDAARCPWDYRWVALRGRARPSADLFVARVDLAAIDRRITPGSFVLFRLRPRPPLDGRLVLARHRDLTDPELGDGVTLRLYGAEMGENGVRVTLRPASSDSRFAAMVLEDVEEGDLRIVAEMVEILG